MQKRKSKGSPEIKAQPIFQKHLFFSTALFITVVIGVIFGAAYYVLRSLNTRIEQEISWLGESVSQRVSDEVETLATRDRTGTGADDTVVQQSLQTYMDAQLQSLPALYYLILENLEGQVVAQSFKESIRPDEIDLLRRGAIKPRQPRSQQIELQGLLNSHLRIRDYGIPVRLNARSMGQLRLGISNDYLQDRMSTIRNEIYRRAIVLSTITVGVFTFIFFYVRWLVKRAQGLEAQAQEADRLAYLGTLAGGLAHEIRNPLSAMNLNIQMIEEDLKSSRSQAPEFLQLFEGTKREIRRLERLATNFLTYTRPLHLQLQPMDLCEMLEDVCGNFGIQLKSMGIDFSLSLEGLGAAPIRGDHDLLKQALLNLLSNAKDAIVVSERNDSVIRVSLRRVDGGYQMEFFDNGIGVPEDRLKSIFEIFYSDKRGGTGLGLPIARRIIERHGGSIEAESDPGTFTRFRVFIPG